VNLHTPLQQKTIQRRSACFENNKKHSKSAYQIDPMKSVKKTPRNANLAKFSRKNFAKFGSYKCAFRWSENAIIKKERCFYEHGSRFAGFLPVPSQEMR
jgi:hypothetical protein